MKIGDAMRVAEVLLPRLAVLTWTRKQALLQEREAAGEEKGRWQVVVGVVEQTIREEERRVKESLGVLKFKTNNKVFL